MIHSNDTRTLRAQLAALGIASLFAANQAYASPRSRVRTMTRSAAVANDDAAKPRSANTEPSRDQEDSAKYYLNVIGSSAGEISLEDAAGVATDRVVLFTERRLGLYPKFWNGRRFNGGLPQLADLNAHLTRVRRDVAAAIPDADWDGFAVIDYEAWHLLWEYMPEVYREESRKVVRSGRPNLPEMQVEEIARGEFENAAIQFVTETLDLCRQLRPKARWGMYGYPQTPNPARLAREADLYTHVDALYPSIYARKWSVLRGVTPQEGQATLSRYKNRIDAMIGVSQTIAQGRPVLVYTWRRYNTSNSVYGRHLLNDLDLSMMLSEPVAAGADGVILWDGIKTSTDAAEYQRYFQDRMLPLIQTIAGGSSDEAASVELAGDTTAGDATARDVTTRGATTNDVSAARKGRSPVAKKRSRGRRLKPHRGRVKSHNQEASHAGG